MRVSESIVATRAAYRVSSLVIPLYTKAFSHCVIHRRTLDFQKGGTLNATRDTCAGGAVASSVDILVEKKKFGERKKQAKISAKFQPVGDRIPLKRRGALQSKTEREDLC